VAPASLAPWLTGAPGPARGRGENVAAARVAWHATGDPELVVPTLRAVLHAEAADGPGAGAAAGKAAELLAELGSGHDLIPQLWTALRTGGRHGRPGVARALWRLGEPTGDLVAVLVAAVADPVDDAGAIDLLVELGASEAVPGLSELAARDQRVVTAGGADPVWRDERLCHRLRAAITTLSRDRRHDHGAVATSQRRGA
jgi:hypothetical protein